MIDNTPTNHLAPCPSCGYCPTCGRKNAAPVYPYQPYWLNPGWYYQPYQWTWTGTTTIPANGTAQITYTGTTPDPLA